MSILKNPNVYSNQINEAIEDAQIITLSSGSISFFHKGLDIEVNLSPFGTEKVVINDEVVSKKWSLFNTTHQFEYKSICYKIMVHTHKIFRGEVLLVLYADNELVDLKGAKYFDEEYEEILNNFNWKKFAKGSAKFLLQLAVIAGVGYLVGMFAARLFG